jgi:hypothetical protein
MEIDINTKIMQLFELLVNLQPLKQVPLETLNPIFSKINTLIYHLKTSERDKIPDAIMKMLYDFLEELKTTLEKISNEGNSLLSHLRNLFPGSNIKHLQAMIPRLDDIYNKIIQTLSTQSVRDQQINRKRKTPPDQDDNEDNDELGLGQKVQKKIKTALDDRPTISQDNEWPFFVRLICDPEIKNYIPEETKLKYPHALEGGIKSEITFKREEFSNLPLDTVVRLSKEHASIQARKDNENIVYELKDLSVNGTFLLGNSVEGRSENPPKRLEQRRTYRLKHGDQIGLLMKKEKQKQEMLLGFEFLEKKNSF